MKIYLIILRKNTGADKNLTIRKRMRNNETKEREIKEGKKFNYWCSSPDYSSNSVLASIFFQKEFLKKKYKLKNV
jgi:hypothetical protein